MHGVWFAATISVLIASGVVAQLGWQLPDKAEVKRVFRRDRSRSGRLSTDPCAAVVVVDRH
jgi:hypothetical protein